MRRMSFAYGREKSLPLVSVEIVMPSAKAKEISVFVDESGSFESGEASSRFYLVCFVMHDQAADITPYVANLESELELHSLGARHCIHAGPLVRREGQYADMLREERQTIFRKMMAFIRKSDICYKCFRVDKHFGDGDGAVHDRLLQEITRFLLDNTQKFVAYDTLKIYYDNGQEQVKSLLKEAFAIFSSSAVFVPNVHPEAYRLFQAADFICTVELVAAKIDNGGMSASEIRFFGDRREFLRNILKPIRRKSI